MRLSAVRVRTPIGCPSMVCVPAVTTRKGSPGLPSRRCSSMKPAMTERAALPVHRTRSSVTASSLFEKQRERVGVQGMLGMPAGAGEEHQITALGALDDHGRDDRHEHAAKGVVPVVAAELI